MRMGVHVSSAEDLLLTEEKLMKWTETTAELGVQETQSQGVKRQGRQRIPTYQKPREEQGQQQHELQAEERSSSHPIKHRTFPLLKAPERTKTQQTLSSHGVEVGNGKVLLTPLITLPPSKPDLLPLEALLQT